jgi:hypothetical protein
MPRIRPVADVRAVSALKAIGHTDREVSALTGVPISTIRLWRNRRLSQHAIRALDPHKFCSTCGRERHDFASLPRETYSYLLAVYLGDGHLNHWGSSWTLRITLDEAYPEIIIGCCDAIERLRSGKRPTPKHHHSGQRCLVISSTWWQWPCLLPQHGPGRKHQRKIELLNWQRRIVEDAPEPFLRGLIHTDGWRGLNRVRVKGKDYSYPRYQFSNRSDDIRKLFTDACDQIGVEWRPWSRWHISVARRESVALLDSFIGPKR